MFFYAVGQRCLVPRDFWGIRLQKNEGQNRLIILRHLEKLGFKLVETSVVREARSCIGAPYERGAKLHEKRPPQSFDCSSLVAYAYGRLGVRMPRIAIDQLEHAPGTSMAPGSFKPGDLIFTDGRRGYWTDDPKRRIGHVAISTGEGTVIHAAYNRGVIEEDERVFFERTTFRGARRVLLKPEEWLTFEAAPEIEVDSSSTVRWRLLSHVR